MWNLLYDGETFSVKWWSQWEKHLSKLNVSEEFLCLDN